MAVALKEPELRVPATIRRFEVADLAKHGPWLLPRLTEATGLPEKIVGGWLQGFIWSNEHMFLYQDHAAALAQAVPGYGLKNGLVIQERFVWVDNRERKETVADAANFYIHFERWAKSQGAEQIIMESSDVPQPLIEEKLGRLFKFETRYARVR